MQKTIRLVVFIVLFIGLGLNALGVQSIVQTTVDISHTSTSVKTESGNDWWIFVILLIEDNYWQNIEAYSLTVTIEGQVQELVLDPTYATESTNEHAFIGSFTGLSTGTHQAKISWQDGQTPKIWISESIQFGKATHVERFHLSAPIILTLTVLSLGVILPGRRYKQASSEDEDLFDSLEDLI